MIFSKSMFDEKITIITTIIGNNVFPLDHEESLIRTLISNFNEV